MLRLICLQHMPTTDGPQGVDTSRPGVRWHRLGSLAGAALLVGALGGCAAWQAADTDDRSDDVAPSRPQRFPAATSAELLKASSRLFSTPVAGVPWEPFFFPGKRYTAFEPVQVLERLGAPYNSTKGRPGGGLGLFLSVNVARTLGGRLSAQNRPQGGAIVTVSLPMSAIAIEVHDHDD